MEHKADPEFVMSEEQEDPPVKLAWWQKLSILGILRFIVGQIRDSSGRPNNILGLLYVAIVFFGAGIWWGTHPVPIKYELDLKLNGQSVQRVVEKGAKRRRIRSIKNGINAAKAKVKGLLSGPQMARSQIRRYKAPGATIQLNLTLKPPEPLPASFWWVLLLLVVGFLGAYLGRHPKMRQWIKNLLLAYRSVSTDDGKSWKEKIFPFLEGFMNAKEKPDLDAPPAMPSPEEQQEESRDPIFDEANLPKREH